MPQPEGWKETPDYDALVIEHRDRFGTEPLEPWERWTGTATDEMAAVAAGSSHVREILADDGDGVLQTCTGCPDWEDESPDRDIADAMWAQHIEGEQHADPVA
jgi:hypothetical protein